MHTAEHTQLSHLNWTWKKKKKKKKKPKKKKKKKKKKKLISVHYENMPIQIYWKFYNQKDENFQIKILICFIFLLKT